MRFLSILCALAAFGCASFGGASGDRPWVPEIPGGVDPIGSIDTSTAADGIVPLPETVDAEIRRWFGRYTKVVAPNGKPIHILAEDGWRRDQILRARKVLEHILTSAPGTRLGADKTAVANAMSDRRATLVLFDDVDSMERAFRGGLHRLELGFQDLRANECPVEGDPDYLRHETRDAAFEEVLHLVHDYGLRPALPEYDEALHRANLALAARGLWQGWPEEEPENHRNEYFAAAYDNYLDLWALEPLRYEGEPLSDDDIPDGTSHFGVFGANSREKLHRVDPVAYELIEDFFPPYITYTAELPETFTGTFHMRLVDDLRYTRKSRHLRSVSLTGDRNADVKGNAWDNTIHGNSGMNVLEGGAGADILCGGGEPDLLRGDDGRDIAVYSGGAEEYEVKVGLESITVRDKREGRDGIDVLIGIEVLRFADGDREAPQPPGWRPR